MKFKFLLLLFACWSCLNCSSTKYENRLILKGYDVNKDTFLLKPYEYYKKSKGYNPYLVECNLENPLTAEISLRGFENTSSIPRNILLDSIQFSISDGSIDTIISAEIRHHYYSTFYVHQVETTNMKSYKYRILKRIRKNNPGNLLLLFCVKVQKNGKVFTLPARAYKIE